jgi:predicted N-acyltransferase
MPPTYRTRIADTPAEIDAAAWNGLLARQPRPTPFLRHEFLAALDAAGCATADTGWQPQFVTLWREDPESDGGEVLAAAAPLYVKSHSYGEYVFDWAWADAYQRNGLAYYPKLLCAVPFSPVTGTRLMAEDTTARAALASTLVALAGQAEVSSLHVLFPDAPELESLRASGMKLRSGVQFHWLNAGYADFDAFLATLEQKKRKNIRAERRKVREAGVTFRHVLGRDIGEADWHLFIRCYRQTYREHHSSPYLNLEFFQRIGAAMPENLLLVIAEREGRPIASSLLVYQREPDGGTLYGRYWGALEQVPCLHFETAYYQPLEFCIAQGIATFEGGAQGEHKMARGFLPTVTHSAHWLAHPAFADAIERFLERESGGIDAYVDELRERNPFKPVAPSRTRPHTRPETPETREIRPPGTSCE